MKCVIDDRITPNWIDEYFKSVDPFMLKFCNKPLIEYYIDICEQLDVDEILIIKGDRASDVEEYIGDGARWGKHVQYSMVKGNDGLSEVIAKNENFVSDEKILYVDEFVFPCFAKSAFDEHTDQKHTRVSDLDRGHIIALDNVESYYTVNKMVIEEDSSQFVLPGYNNEKGIFIGQSVEISRNVEIRPPVMIGDNVQLKSGAVVGPNTIIENNVIVDRNSSVSGSIIHDYTYIGSELQIENKIASGIKLIEPISGESINVVDEFLISRISALPMKEMIYRLIHSLLALSFIVIMAVPFLIVTCVFNVKKAGMGINLYQRLCLDKYRDLFRVLSGDLYLAGTSCKASNEHKVGVFKYSEMISLIKLDDFQVEINDLYYCSNRSIALDLKIVFVVLYKRLFARDNGRV